MDLKGLAADIGLDESAIIGIDIDIYAWDNNEYISQETEDLKISIYDYNTNSFIKIGTTTPGICQWYNFTLQKSALLPHCTF